MKLFTGPQIPSPFGVIKMPDAETPPMKLPEIPDSRGRKAIGHGIGEDAASILGVIPWVGELVEDALQDTHHAEIKKILTAEEYRKFAEYNKSFPSAIALARVLCFRNV